MDVADIAGRLTTEDRAALTSDWDAFCDCDWHLMSCDIKGFAERLEQLGYVTFDAVDDDDLDDAFASERGIVPGGTIWRLTPLGLAVRAHIQGNSHD